MNRDNALLIYSGWMGDFIWLVPTIRALKKKYKSLSLVVSEQEKDLAESLTIGIDRVVDQVFVDIKSKGRAYRMLNQHNIRKAAKKADIGTYIDLVGKWKTALCIPWARGADIYYPAEEDAKKREHRIIRWLHKSANLMQPRDKRGHYVDEYFSMLRDFGVDPYPINFNLNYDQDTIDDADKIIGENNLRVSKSVVLNLGSAQFSKTWSSQNFKDLANRLKKKGYKVVIMGAYDFTWTDHYDRRARDRDFYDYDGLVMIKPKIPTLVNAYLLNSGVFNVSVGNDSFANHMAGSANEVDKDTKGAVKVETGRYAGRYFKANTRTVTLIGPTNPLYCNVWDPTGKFHTIIRSKDYVGLRGQCLDSPCTYVLGVDRECSHYTKIKVAGTTPCMNSIKVEQVSHAVQELIKN